MRLARVGLVCLLLLLGAGQASAEWARMYTGCGIVLGLENGQFVVAGLLGGSPAARAGMRQGDVIASARRRESLNPGDRVRYGDVYSFLNPSTNNVEVTIKALRGGTVKEFRLRSARLPLSSRTAPKSRYGEGRLEFVDGKAYATFPDPDRFRAGDTFYAFKSGKFVGTIVLIARDGSRFQGSPQDFDPDRKSGAGVLTFLRHDFSYSDAISHQAAPRGSEFGVLAMVADDRGPRISAEEEERIFQSFKARTDLEAGVGKVMTHNASERYFLVQVAVSRAPTSPTSGSVRMTNVVIYYTPSTTFIPRSRPESVRAGETIGFYFKKRGVRPYAELIHQLND